MKCFLTGLVGVLLLTTSAFAQTTSAVNERVFVAHTWDMDGVAADADFVMTATAIEDSKTDYTISGGTLDVCRLLDITVVDTDLNSGSVTITGTDCLGFAKVCSFAFTAGDDTGVKTLTCTDGQSAYFKTVTSIVSGVMVGESDETFTVGFTTAGMKEWPMYGTTFTGANGERGVDPFGSVPVLTRVTTSGLSTTLSGTGAFTDVLQDDLLTFNLSTGTYVRKVVARSSADAVVLDRAMNITAPGAVFSYKHFYVSTNPLDRLWFKVNPYENAAFFTNIDANVATGGVTESVECASSPGSDYFIPLQEIYTANTATGATKTNTTAIIYEQAPFAYCRWSFKFGTADDADAANESITLVAGFTRPDR